VGLPAIPDRRVNLNSAKERRKFFARHHSA
jgi:hypothetical protein